MQAKTTEYANMTQQTEGQRSFQETEIGLIPKDWEVVKIGDLFDLQQGKAMSPKSRLGISPRPFLRTVNVLWGRVDLSTLDYMDFTDDKITRLCLRPYDLLVCEGGEIGRTAMWQGEIEVCGYQNHIHRLRKRRQDVWPEFYMYWVQAAFLIFGLYAGQEIRTTIPNLSGGRLRSFLVPKPPLPEQRKIAKVLGIIQRTIEQQDKIIETAKKLKKSLMKKLFTEGLGHTEFKNTEIGQIPASWGVVRLGDVATLQGGYAFKSADYVSEGIRLFKIANVSLGSVCWDEVSYLPFDYSKIYSSYILKEGDIIIAMTRPIIHNGIKAARITSRDSPSLLNQRVGRFLIKGRIISDFLYQIIFTPKFIKEIRLKALGSHQPNISAKKIGSIEIPLPPISEQQKIAHILNTFDRKIDVEERRKATFNELFKSMLGKLMTGEVRLKDVEV